TQGYSSAASDGYKRQAIICALIVVCLAVGVGISNKSRNAENETNLISNKETVSIADESSVSSEKTETISVKDETEAKSSVNSISSTEKTEANSVKSKGKPLNPITSYSNKVTEEKAPEKSSSKKVTEAKPPVKATKEQNISVSFSVNCEKAAQYGADYPKYLISKTKCDVKEGTTVFDLLSQECSKNGIAVVHQNKSYVKAIGGLAEKDCGNGSGWTYKVNGVKPMMSASKYVLKNGDVVEWYYVTSPTD
ncbi:MAG: DUF4430 domain-containing protein, partial [Eubacterium sp.]|nr:DUF4430 domain-containing protein [Eubacterium sp.]